VNLSGAESAPSRRWNACSTDSRHDRVGDAGLAPGAGLRLQAYFNQCLPDCARSDFPKCAVPVARQFDFAFIDADKTGYAAYYEEVLSVCGPPA
jgi:O-methyltransferase